MGHSEHAAPPISRLIPACLIFLAPWIKKFQAEIIVIGGNISETLGMYGDILEGKLPENGVDTRIARSGLKENAAMIGSARMLDEDYFEKIKLLLAKM